MCEQCLPVRSSYGRRTLLRAAAVAATAYALSGGRSRAQDAQDAQDNGIEVTGGLVIRPRSAWDGGRRPTGPLQAEDVRFLLVHHTASGNSYTQAQVPGVMQGAFDFHTGPDKGWPDVAYNFFVDRYGGVWEGRTGSLGGPVTADATGGSQGFAQLVCLIGDFTSVMPTDAALDALTRVLAWLGQRHGIDTSPGATTEFVSRGSQLWPSGTSVTAATISGHRDMSNTACPGDTFYPYLVSEMATRVSALRGGSSPVTPTTAPPVASTTSAAPPTPTTAPATTSPPATTSTSATTLPAESPSTTTTPPSSTSSPARVDVTAPSTSVTRATLVSAGGTTSASALTTPDDGTGSATGSNGDGDDGSRTVALAAIGVGVGAAAVGMFALRRGRMIEALEAERRADDPQP